MRCGLSGLLPSFMSPAEPSSSVRREEGLQQQCEGTLRVHVVFSMFKELLEEGLQKCLCVAGPRGGGLESMKAPGTRLQDGGSHAVCCPGVFGAR